MGGEMMDTEGTREARREYQQALAKLWWVGALVNSAGLIALVQLVGGLDDPDYAFSALTWPFLMMLGGVGTGLIALLVGQASLLHGIEEAYRYAANSEIDELEEHVERIEKRAKENEVPLLWDLSEPKVIATKERITKLKSDNKSGASDARRNYMREGLRAFQISCFSCGLFAGALAIAFAAHLSGGRLQPPDEPARPPAAQVPARLG